ncbi:hypothetical protein TNCV_864171 [Trichonephila clavipes]|nr:hypothetical protein TNCV_864171 [Trichonephila clavipes]
MGIHYRRTTSFSEENISVPYSGFKPEPTRLQAEGHIHHTEWATATTNTSLEFLNAKLFPSKIFLELHFNRTTLCPSPPMLPGMLKTAFHHS